MIHNFNAGPSILPKEVFEQAAAAVLDYNNTGLSILEIGHRTGMFQAVMEEARSLVKELMQLDNNHEVLFLHGGASTQFMQVPMNLLDAKDIAAYSDTGVWGQKAIKEAKYKVQATIQSDQLRVTSKSKDELQTTMNFIRGQDYGLPLQFNTDDPIIAPAHHLRTTGSRALHLAGRDTCPCPSTSHSRFCAPRR